MYLAGHRPGSLGNRLFHAHESHFEKLLDLLLGVETHGRLFGTIHDIVDPLPDIALDRAEQRFRHHVDLHGSPLSDDARLPHAAAGPGGLGCFPSDQQRGKPVAMRGHQTAMLHVTHYNDKCYRINSSRFVGSVLPDRTISGWHLSTRFAKRGDWRLRFGCSGTVSRSGGVVAPRPHPEIRIVVERWTPESRMKECDGFALPASLLVLLALLLLFTAGFHSARMDLLSTRSLASSIRAFQAAEAGLALLETGAASGIDSASLRATVLDMRIDTLRASGDGSFLLRYRVEAVTRDGVGRTTARRSLSRLWFVRPDGTRGPVAGGWSESLRLDPP